MTISSLVNRNLSNIFIPFWFHNKTIVAKRNIFYNTILSIRSCRKAKSIYGSLTISGKLPIATKSASN